MGTHLTQKVSTFLWFNDQAMQAAEFYIRLFKDSRIIAVSHYDEGMHMPAGTVLLVEFEIASVRLYAMNGGPGAKLTQAVSLAVECENQSEIDRVWDALTSDGGAPMQCGWLTDKFGLSWQVWPASLVPIMRDPERMRKVMPAVMSMVKLDEAELLRAAPR